MTTTEAERSREDGNESAVDHFSLVLGGPLYQMLRRTQLSGDALEHLRRRIVVLTALAWVPLLVLSAVEGHAWSGVDLPFFRDVELRGFR